MSHINTHTFLIHPAFPRFWVPTQITRVLLPLRRGHVSTTVRPQLVSVHPRTVRMLLHICKDLENLPPAIKPTFPALAGGYGGRADEVFGPPDGAEEVEWGRRAGVQLAVAI